MRSSAVGQENNRQSSVTSSLSRRTQPKLQTFFWSELSRKLECLRLISTPELQTIVCESKADMRAGRNYFGATVLDGVIYAAGGVGQAGMEMYDPKVGHWQSSPGEMPGGVRSHFELIVMRVPFKYLSNN